MLTVLCTLDLIFSSQNVRTKRVTGFWGDHKNGQKHSRLYNCSAQMHLKLVANVFNKEYYVSHISLVALSPGRTTKPFKNTARRITQTLSLRRQQWTLHFIINCVSNAVPQDEARSVKSPYRYTRGWSSVEVVLDEFLGYSWISF